MRQPSVLNQQPSTLNPQPSTARCGQVSKDWLLAWAKRVCTVSGAFGSDTADITAHVPSPSHNLWVGLQRRKKALTQTQTHRDQLLTLALAKRAVAT